MTGGGPCGRRGGYHQHITEGTAPCPPCREAERMAKERWRKRSYLNHGPLMVDATGTRRRIQALARIGWSAVDIGRRMGVTHGTVSYWSARKTVRVATAAKVAVLYDELSMTPGPSRKAAAWARKQGWPPPLAFDDDTIDDPATVPAVAPPVSIDAVAVERAMRGYPTHLRRPERTEAVRRLTAAGLSAAQIAERLHTTKRSVVRQRTGGRDVA